MAFGAPSSAQKWIEWISLCKAPRAKLVPLCGLKPWNFFLIQTLFDEIISKKLNNTPSGITLIIDLKSALHMQEFLGYAAARLPRATWEQRFGLARGAAASILQKIRDQCIDDDPPQLSAHFVTGLVEGDGGFSCALVCSPRAL